MPQADQSNTLGLAGFITSLVGFALTGGLLCPVGLILSLIALRRQPRGFAIAGVVLGVMGSCGGCIIALFVLPAIAIAIAGGATVLTAAAFMLVGGTPAMETFDHMFQIKREIGVYAKQHGAPPTSLADLNLPADMLDDGWGTPLQYQMSGSAPAWKWSLQTAGPNRQLEQDDFTFSGEFTAKP
jgi:hypothetical protein